LAYSNYTDTVDLYNSNQYVYYTVKALDKRFNHSEFSEALEVEKPLRVQPSSPVFTSFRVEKDGINLEWINCPDEICVRHILYRMQKDSSTFNVIKVFEGQEISSYKDTTVLGGIAYTYYLTSQSKWEVESLPSPSLQVVGSLSNRPELILKFSHKKFQEERHIRLFWEVSNPEIVKMYRVYRSENQVPISLWQETEDLSIIDNKLKTGYSYQYIVQAVCFDGRISEKKEIIVNY